MGGNGLSCIFLSIWNKKKHFKVGFGLRNCNFSFVHESKKPFQCKICPKKFAVNCLRQQVWPTQCMPMDLKMDANDLIS